MRRNKCAPDALFEIHGELVEALALHCHHLGRQQAGEDSVPFRQVSRPGEPGRLLAGELQAAVDEERAEVLEADSNTWLCNP